MTMTSQHTGWIILVSAGGMMAGLMANEVRELTSWGQATTPAFLAGFLAHFATVVAAFVAGRLIPK